MPLYEYQCQQCENRFEKIQKFSDPHEEVCPSCGGKVEKLVSSPAIQFKGSGWYITDYAKKSSTDGGKSSSEKKTETSSSSSAGESASTTASSPSTSTTKE